MPRKAEPSFELKKIIWDLAATVGKDKPTDIQRQLDYELEKRRKEEGDFFEDAPDVRTISRIVEEINKLRPEVVVSKLEPRVWHLRNDYESIKRLAEGTSQTSQKEAGALVAKAQEEHLSEIRNLIEEWRDAVRTPQIEESVPGYHHPISDVEANHDFESLKEHIPYPALWLNYIIWSGKINSYLFHCADLMKHVRRDYRFAEMEVINGTNDFEWLCTEDFAYHEPIMRRLSNLARTNQISDHIIGIGDRKYIDDFDEFDSRPTEPRGSVSVTCIIYVDNIPVGTCDNECYTEVKKLYLSVSDYFLNDDHAKYVIRLYRELKSLENKAHGCLEESLAYHDYLWYTCKFCRGYHSPGVDKQRWPQWTAQSMYTSLMDEHFKSLIPTSKELTARLEILISFREQWIGTGVPEIEGNIIDGCFLINPTNREDCWPVHYSQFPNPLDNSQLLDIHKPIDGLQAQCLLEHFNHQFPKLAHYNNWPTLNFNNLHPTLLRKICSWLENEEFKQYGCYVCWLLKTGFGEQG